MSAGYVIAQLKVTNTENYKEYVEKVPDVIKKYGGEYLARGGEHQVFEGEDNFPRIVIICLLYTSPSPRDRTRSRMPSSA